MTSQDFKANAHASLVRDDPVYKPSFFIVGAPRCGTTALSEYLRTHPRVFMSTPKEPNYFSFDMSRPRAAETLDGYLDLFRESNGAVAGEASVWYLFSRAAVPEIMRFNPNSKIIVMVRSPVDMLLSWHAQRVYTLNEDETDFEAAWRMQDARREGRSIPKFCAEPELLQYRHVATLGEQLERAFEVVPGDQIKVIVFDDFVKDTRQAYESVESFLSIPYDGKADFPQVHRSRRHRSLRLARLLRRRPLPVRAVLKGFRAMGVDDRALRRRLGSWNSTIGFHKRLRPAFKKELADTFGSDVEKLGQLLNRDLSHWLSK